MVRTAFALIAATASSAFYLRVVIADVAPPIHRLDGLTRGRVLLALTGLIMLGILMMGLTWLGFRMLRGQFRRTDEIVEREKRSRNPEDWANKPLE